MSIGMSCAPLLDLDALSLDDLKKLVVQLLTRITALEEENRRLREDNEILRDAVRRARGRLEYSPLATTFCRPEFTIADLRGIYEAIWGVRLDPANFHRKVTRADGFLVETGRTAEGGPGRPAQLYRRGRAERIHPPLNLGPSD